MTKAPKPTEAQVLRAIRLALGKLPDVVLWRNEGGVAHHGDKLVRYGLCPGSADLIGVGPGGRMLAIEVKRPGGKTSAKQRDFLDLVMLYGGIAGVASSVEEALAIVEAAR